MKTDAFLNAEPRTLTRSLLTVLVALFVTGCAEMPSQATIDDRTSKNPERRKSSAAITQPSGQSSSQPASKTSQPAASGTDNTNATVTKQASTEPLPLAGADPAGYYTVKKGDTLLKIADQFGRTVGELSEWNALPNPNAINVGRLLRIAPVDNTQVMSVPMESDMELRRAGRPARPSNVPQTNARAMPLHKTGPLGQKIVYSDKAIADLERGDPGPVRTLEPTKKAAETQPSGATRFIWPTEGRVISAFDPTRKGIDIAGKAGQPVVAASDGKVLYAKNMRGYGNLIILEHSDSMVTAYAHNKTILVREGQTVTQRQQIAEMGDSDADAVKLRFQIRHMGKPVDPATLLPPPADPQTPPSR
jgi:lipoprotein NlpD